VSYPPAPDFTPEPFPPSTPPEEDYLPIPQYQPFVTYLILAAIVLIWLMMTLAGGSTNTQVLVDFGANAGWKILIDHEYWRLFTSMFLHVGLTHLAFNAYALFAFGVEMERLYGPARFTVVYLLSGLFGSLVSFAARGPLVLSAGASGAIFGIIGMNLAYFVLHRESFGDFGRQRLMSTLFIIAINLVFGLTVPGIDNFAHMGGLVAGFVLGYGLAPRYQLGYRQLLHSPPRTDTVSLLNRWWVPVLGVLALTGGLYLTTTIWLALRGS
jgi:membrane associated rhomboid family serine protease